MYEELVKRLRNEAETERWLLPHSDNGTAAILDEAADAIEELQAQLMFSNDAAKAIAEKVPKWIPVTERLPKEFGRYLCRYRVEDNETIGYCTDFGRYDPEHGEWYANTVTHWMPLPEPPKDDEA